MVRGEVAVAGALGAAGGGAPGVDGGRGAGDVIVTGMGDGMGEPYPAACAAGGTDSDGDVGDVLADGAAYGGVAEGGVGDAPGVGVLGDADVEGVVGDAPGVSAAGDAFLDGEGAAGGVTAATPAGDDDSEGVAGDGSGCEFAYGWSSAVLGVGPRFSGRLWSVGLPVLAGLVASAVWACPRQTRRVLMVRVV